MQWFIGVYKNWGCCINLCLFPQRTQCDFPSLLAARCMPQYRVVRCVSNGDARRVFACRPYTIFLSVVAHIQFNISGYIFYCTEIYILDLRPAILPHCHSVYFTGPTDWLTVGNYIFNWLARPTRGRDYKAKCWRCTWHSKIMKKSIE